MELGKDVLLAFMEHLQKSLHLKHKLVAGNKNQNFRNVATITKHSRLFLLIRHQIACTRCLHPSINKILVMVNDSDNPSLNSANDFSFKSLKKETKNRLGFAHKI